MFYGSFKNVKKILIFALILYTPYVLPSHSSPSPGQDLAVSCAALVSGIICTWLAYKEFEKVNQAKKVVQRQMNILLGIGVKVYKQFQREWVLGLIPTSVLREHYTIMDIPSNFSQQQREKAKEFWSLLLVSQKKDDDYFLAFTAGLGSLILIPTGIVSIIQSIKLLLH